MNQRREKGNVVVETASRLMIPFIQLFALYVITHGSLGPGGGFQGGVVFASTFILYTVVFNITRGKKRLPESVNTVLISAGLYIYAGIGLLSIVFSWGAAQYLNYGFIPFTSHFEENRALGIDLVEIGIGITVMAVITSIFFDLAGKEEKESQE
ncbi:MAG: Na(+)/H(+) antiporter subunit B [Thermodesulfobacteriota bacterium]|nr:Na(+)/H(+) antiporter subunit B [Thermodesulfobacteriota bacterium]